MQMYTHYQDVTSGLPPFPEQGLRDAILSFVRKGTPSTIRAISALTNDDGHMDFKRLVAMCEVAVKSPRALKAMLAA